MRSRLLLCCVYPVCLLHISVVVQAILLLAWRSFTLPLLLMPCTLCCNRFALLALSTLEFLCTRVFLDRNINGEIGTVLLFPCWGKTVTCELRMYVAEILRFLYLKSHFTVINAYYCWNQRLLNHVIKYKMGILDRQIFSNAAKHHSRCMYLTMPESYIFDHANQGSLSCTRPEVRGIFYIFSCSMYLNNIYIHHLSVKRSLFGSVIGIRYCLGNFIIWELHFEYMALLMFT